MNRCRRWMFAVLAVAAVPALFPPSHAAGGDDYAFMPKGGRALLLEVVPQPKGEADLRQITQQKRTEQEWRAYVDDRGKVVARAEPFTRTVLRGERFVSESLNEIFNRAHVFSSSKIGMAFQARSVPPMGPVCRSGLTDNLRIGNFFRN